MNRFVAVVALAFVPLAGAQSLKLTVFERLKPQASDVVNLSLNKNLIGLGISVLGNAQGDAAKLKKLIEGLDGILIHSLEFEKTGVYSEADVKQIISEMAGTGWDLVISADEKHKSGPEMSRIWVKTGAGGEVGGLRILTVEPKELSVVEITGKVDVKDLADLNSLIPNVGLDHANQPAKKNDE